MQYRPGKESDFDHLETFVWQAIFPAFDVPGLSEDQRAENDQLVAEARNEAIASLHRSDRLVLTAWDHRRRSLVGYLILSWGTGSYSELVRLIVKRGAWGVGVGRELLMKGLEQVSERQSVVLAIRPYNQRAIAFFTKHGFVDSGEAAGDARGTDRILMIREAGLGTGDGASVAVEADPPEDDFPTEADEPYFEALPDYRLATEELSEPVFDAEHSSLDREQFTELEDFIARAKAQKARQAEGTPEKKTTARTARPTPTTRHPEIELEIDYGEASAPREKTITEPTGFSFAFDPENAAPASPPDEEPPTTEGGGAQEPTEETLELKDIPPEITVAELREELEDRLGDRLTAFFGADALPDYLNLYRNDDNFHRIRDVSLTALSTWLNAHPRNARSARRRRGVLADLTEYFMVETGAGLHDNLFPQRLLRYQGRDWREIDLFRLVMAYLDLDIDAESVYTDFVAMPARILKNATASYLRAGRDERVFFIFDQSLFGNGKQGFALTDSALYWKNVLQPPGAATYTTVRRVDVHGDHLMIDGQYFDAGRRLNLRVALLLDKLRGMDLSD
ncbi:GNAT family N-acetyltransferase [Lewinella sp. JB7]|uniref:GNAT family N-acetyltransferase n=1 Tax=Lewinella sp. JB7 TaxID=2962887 RepID=UPI0020C93DEF|nr:GNAT family N-acetyltransferase [Lewinella sp. JB7]MCP9237545.1 GNAT family N-acetyltransferase [Lewinella sp. JB7]